MKRGRTGAGVVNDTMKVTRADEDILKWSYEPRCRIISAMNFEEQYEGSALVKPVTKRYRIAHRSSVIEHANVLVGAGVAGRIVAVSKRRLARRDALASCRVRRLAAAVRAQCRMRRN